MGRWPTDNADAHVEQSNNGQEYEVGDPFVADTMNRIVKDLMYLYINLDPSATHIDIPNDYVVVLFNTIMILDRNNIKALLAEYGIDDWPTDPEHALTNWKITYAGNEFEFVNTLYVYNSSLGLSYDQRIQINSVEEFYYDKTDKTVYVKLTVGLKAPTAA